MSIEITCPRCGRRYVLPDSQAGERVRCTECRRALTVPDTGLMPFEALMQGHGLGRGWRIVLCAAGVILVVGLTLAILGIIVPPAVERARVEAWRQARERTIAQLAHAMTAYAAQNGDALPFDADGPYQALAKLYPDYVTSADAFRYPLLSAAAAPRARFPDGCALAGSPCAYRYYQDEAAKAEGPVMIVLEEVLPQGGQASHFVMQADGRIRSVGGEELEGGG